MTAAAAALKRRQLFVLGKLLQLMCCNKGVLR